MSVVKEDIVRLKSRLVEDIKAHSRREAEKDAEAVGFLAKRPNDPNVTVRVPLNNHASDRSTAFFVEPWEQFRAETKLGESGYEIVGVYHSHPHSEALPSMADKAMARPGELVVIYSVVYDDIRAWREHHGELLPVEMT